MKSIYRTLWASFSRVDTKRVYLYSLIIGVLAGLGALAFYWCLAAATHATYGWIAQIDVPQPGDGESYFGEVVGEPRRWVFFFMPAIGGLVAGWLVYRFAPEAEGTGTEGFLDAFHNKGGIMRRRVALVKSIATIFTLASGGSAGKEGPVAQIGASIGAIFGKWLKIGERARRTLLLAGTAGGLGAIFRAPLGGTFTAIEVLYKEDFETDALIPCLLSSVMAYTVFCSVMGFHHIFAIDLEPFHNPAQLIFYIILGFLCSGTGFLYIKFFHGVKDKVFSKIPVPKYVLPAIGGVLVGTIGFFYPQITGASLGYIQQAMNGEFGDDWMVATRLFLILAMLKIIATSFTVQSGGSGGVFGPSLFIGGMLGGVVGTVSNHFFPHLVPDVAPFVVVGMAAFFACVASAPIASIIMVSELTGGYQLLPALMAVAAISLIFSRGTSIYRNQVLNKFASKAHLWDMNPYVLAKIAIKSAFKGGYRHHAVISINDTYTHVEQLAAKIHETDFVVKDAEGRFVGAFSLKDTHFIQDIAEAKKLLVVTDLVSTKAPFVTPDDTLFVAMERLLDSDFDKIAVVEDPDDARKLLGYVRQREILAVYRSTHAVANLSARP
jgi:chloride channel protein, CIC family